jgi:TatD DNase family protein
MLVDSHCHLDFPEFAPEIAQVVARAQAAGVGICVTIGTKLSAATRVREIAEEFPSVFCSVGIHPHEAAAERLSSEHPLIELAAHRKVVGIGETGLDYYYEHSPREAQIANFRAHIKAARVTGLPLIVHTRDAEDDTIAILREEMEEGAFTGLIHCFTGTARLAKAALDMDLCISASGILTFKKADALRDVLCDVPLERLLVETDAPYLAPVPHRGGRNEPAYVAETAKVLAGLKGIAPDALAQATTENFLRLFTRVPPSLQA